MLFRFDRQGITGSQEYSSSHSSVNSFERIRQDKPGKDKSKAKGKDADKDAERDVGSYSANPSANQSSSMNTSSAPSYTESQRQFCRTAFIRGNMVSLRMIRKRTIKLDRRVLEDMRQVGLTSACDVFLKPRSIFEYDHMTAIVMTSCYGNRQTAKTP